MAACCWLGAAAGCGDDGGGDEADTTDAGHDAAADIEAPPSIDFACPGGEIAEGMNTVMVGDEARQFHAQFPSSMPDGSLGIVFSWHGYNDPLSDGDAAGWRSIDEVDADADPSNPVVVVTPIDIDFDIPVGLDWQLNEPTAATNADLAFFEAMVGCLDAQYDIDPTRVYSYGFSAGSVMSSLLHSAYPNLVSAIVAVSGLWFNDPAEVAMIQLVMVSGSWPELDAADDGTVLLTHGGPNDVTVANVANLENMAQAAFPFLAAANRVVVDCPHNNGHALHPELTTDHVMGFFAAHRGGEASPYLEEPPSGFPSSCSLRLP
jgi:poly(3-hydroxybutyrate) depolymerase